MNFNKYASKATAPKKADEVSYKVIEKLGVLSTSGKWQKELRFISWNDNEPKFDIRAWQTQDDGTEKMQKGITLTADELKELQKIICD